MEGHIQAMGASEGGESGQVLKGSEVMVAGATDPFAPDAQTQGQVRIGPGISRR
jgi:hypothetical protein